MNSLQYHSVIPENYQSQGYGEHDNVDLVLTFPNRVLNLGSVRIEGELEITQDGLPLNNVANANKDIKIDNMVGAHSVIETIQVSFGMGGGSIGGEIVENLINYPRYVKMDSTARHSQSEMNNASQACELKSSFPNFENALLKGEVVETQPSVALRNNPDFSIKPLCCLNSSSATIPYSKTGDIRVSLNLARIVGVLYGIDVDSKTSYKVHNLQLTFTSGLDTGNNPDVSLRTKMSISQSVQSGFSNVSAKVPAIVSSVSCSFNFQNEENTYNNNHLDLVKVPNLRELQFLFNDSTNKGIAFLLRSPVETIERYIESFMDTGENALSRQNMSSNNGYGVGLYFGGDAIDLRNQKFNTQLTSSINSGNPMVMYMYFHSILNL